MSNSKSNRRQTGGTWFLKVDPLWCGGPLKTKWTRKREEMKMVLKVEVYRGPLDGYEWHRPFRQAITFPRTLHVDILIFVGNNSVPKTLYVFSKRAKIRSKLGPDRIIQLQKAVDGLG